MPHLPAPRAPRSRRRAAAALTGVLGLALFGLPHDASAVSSRTHRAAPHATTASTTATPVEPHTITVGDPTVHPVAPPPAGLAPGARAAHTAQTATPTFTVTYVGTVDPSYQAAVDDALAKWSAVIQSPVTIRVKVAITDLGEGVLGGAGPQGWFEVPGGDPGVVYPQALANAMSGYDVAPNTDDIYATFDDDAGGIGSDWYLGTDGDTPSNLYDFESTVLHEIGHGLGFYATADSASSTCPVNVGCFGLYRTSNDTAPSSFDTHLTYGATGPSLLTYLTTSSWTSTLAPNKTGALLSYFRSQNLYFQGLFTNLATPATRARIYAPSSWEPGSSVSHLDESSYPDGGTEALMTPRLGRGKATHTIGPMTKGMLADIGWHVADVVDPYNEAFTKAAYSDFLHRLPTSSEVALRVDQLGRRVLSHHALVDQLARSPEWVDVQVDALYHATLDRSPDAGGLHYWTGLVSSGQITMAQLATLLYSSDEAFSVLAHNSVSSWVTVLYADLLERTPDSAGRAYWTELAATRGRSTVAFALYQSAESRAHRVEELYDLLLGRAADAGGLGFWTTYLTNGDDVALAANLAASDEYFLRSMTRGL